MGYLSHVEGSDTRDCVTWMDDGWCLSLGLREDDVDHFVGGGDRLDGFEVVRHGC